ncbi:MAG: hypothetical protein WC723_02795 [Candidatus Omnitrophota bacterium]
MPVKKVLGNIGIKIRVFIFYSLAGIAKIIYLLYVATIEPRTVTINPKYHPRGIPTEFNAIYVYWHSKLFMIMPMCRNSRLVGLTLLDWKNFFYDKLCRVFGYYTIPLTSDASAARKLKQMADDGFNIALAVDGPRGPLGVVRPGAAYLAQKTKRPIISANIKFDKSIRLWRRWDKLEIPFPFSRATLTFGEPIYPDGKSIKEISDELKMKLGDC